MAYVVPTNQSTGDLITPSIWNQNVVANPKATAVGIATAAGEIPYATGVNALAMLSPGAQNSVPYMGGSNVPAWLAGSASKFLGWDSSGAIGAQTLPPSMPAPVDWYRQPATDQMVFFPIIDNFTANSGMDMDAAGWQLNSVTHENGLGAQAADLNAANDTISRMLKLDASNDFVKCPEIIGTYAHLQAVGALLGATVATITIDLLSAFASTTTETDGGVGVGQAPADFDGATSGAGFHLGATNFTFSVNGADTDTGVAKDTLPHKFTIVINIAAVTCHAYIDDAQVATSVALPTDVWPWTAGWYRGTSNNQYIGYLRIRHAA